MSGFSAAWLSLREPADAAARSVRLTALAAESLRGAVPLRAVDLATGSGANIRYLSPVVGPADWLAVDDDPALLALTPGAIDRRRADLRVEPLDDLVDDRALVTASALLDLVSAAWLQRLARACAGAPVVLFALTYDGRIACSPAEPEDEEIRTLVNRHQRTDKGFGPALGPDAAGAALTALRRVGFDVAADASDWVLGAAEAALQRELIAGWAAAAIAIAPERAGAVTGWQARRMAHVDAGRSCVVVGHQDILGRGRPSTSPERQPRPVPDL